MDMIMTLCSPLSPESPARSAMGSVVLCQWSLCRGQDWIGVLPTPLPLPLPLLQLRGPSPRPTLLEWGTAWTQRRCRAAAAAVRGRPSKWPTPLPQSASIPTGPSARPISCSTCSRWWWRPCGNTSLPGPSMHQWMQSNLTCLWVLAFSFCAWCHQTRPRTNCRHVVCIQLYLYMLLYVNLWAFVFITVYKPTRLHICFTEFPSIYFIHSIFVDVRAYYPRRNHMVAFIIVQCGKKNNLHTF